VIWTEAALYIGVAAVAVIFLLGWVTGTFIFMVNPNSKFIIWCEVTAAIFGGRIEVNEDYDSQVSKQQREYKEKEDDK
jgi:hypothetical protein|tara:strand:+ start:270 stop:503 length:234 start_codon:yes stop_codon:yes gene_type:complete